VDSGVVDNVKAVVSVVAELVAELLVRFFQQLLECLQLWRTKASSLVAAQKCVYTLTICCRGEAVLLRNKNTD